MGIKGVHISLGTCALASILMLTSMLLEWQVLSLAALVTGQVHLTSVKWNGVIPTRYFEHSSFTQEDLTGSLSSVRDLVCGVPGVGFFKTLCHSFTVDFVCGVITILLYIVALVLNIIASSYLLYYSWGVTKREYRRIAFRCFCVSPVLMFIALCVYTGAICLSRTLRIRVLISAKIVVTEGAGYFVAIFAFIIMAIVPFISKKWALSTKEILDDEQRQRRRDAKEALFNSYNCASSNNNINYGTMYPPPSGSCRDDGYDNHTPGYGVYPSLHEPQCSEHYVGDAGLYQEPHMDCPPAGSYPVYATDHPNDFPADYLQQSGGYGYPPQTAYY